MLQYSITIKWSDEDDGYIAVIPELPGLSAFGKTQEEALNELKVATAAYLATLKKEGQTFPTPEKLISYSGQLRVRMPKTLHAKLSAAAENEGVSLNTYIVSLLSERQGEKEIVEQIRKLSGTIRELQQVVRYKTTKTGYAQIYTDLPVSYETGSLSNLEGRTN